MDKPGRSRMKAPAPSARAEGDLYRAHLAAIVESSRDAIVGVDLDGIVISWNGGAETIYGFSAAEMIGAPASRLVPPQFAHEEEDVFERLLRGERVDILQTLRLTRSGRLAEIGMTISPIRDAGGNIVGVSNIARDISGVKAREHEIERLAKLYDALGRVNRAIVSSTTRDELFRKVCRVLVERGGFHTAWVGWRDAATQRIVPVAQYGDSHGYLTQLDIYADERPAGRGPTGIAFRAGRTYIANDLLNDPAAAPWRQRMEQSGFRASAVLPIRVSGEVNGALTVYSDQPGFFQQPEIALLEEAASDLSFALDSFERENARIEAEHKLRSEKQFSDTMIESTPGVVYVYDEQLRFLRWNRTFETVTGYTADEIPGMTPSDFFAADEQAPLAEAIGRVFAEGAAWIEADLLAKTGERLPYLFTGRRVVFDGKNCLVGVGVDIAGRKRAEIGLKESERKYREVVEYAHNIILRWNADGRITFLNDYGQRFFGYAAEEIIGRNVLGTIVPETESSGRDLAQLMQDIQIDPEAFEQNVNENMRRGGERVWVAWTNHVMRGADGRVAEILSIGSDLSERMNAESERARRERAEEADRIKSAFLATMSHELRTPLNSIIGFTGIVLKGLAGPLNAEQSKQLGMVRKSARHLLALVNDVLDISKIEAGQLEVAWQPFDARRSLEKAIGLVAPQAEAKGLALQSVVAPDVAGAVGDQRRFEQILLNLLGNAVKFTGKGSVTLAADTATHANLGGIPAGEAVLRVRVTDTGIGIKPEDLATLFQPFRQIDTGLARSHEGSGLGLAICRRLAGLMGGEISATSEWERGSTFTLMLPLRKPDRG